MDKKQSGGKGGDSPESNFNKGGKPDARKESNFLKKCYSLKEQIPKGTKVK
jgi:hypothetical protein